jgi:small subunit ribosomal protein S14
MAKKSMIEREKKRLSLVNQYLSKRSDLKSQLKEKGAKGLFKEQFEISAQLQKLPRNSSKTRVHNRCFVTGRSKGYFRDFGLSRHVLREWGHACLLPGLLKASW